jgi:hypothetical protein
VLKQWSCRLFTQKTSYTDLLNALKLDTFAYEKGVKNKHTAKQFQDRFLEKKTNFS